MTTPPPNLDPAAEIASHNEKRLRRMWALTPQERLERFQQVQVTMWASLKSNPIALEHFHRRNHRARRPSEMKRLEREMRRGTSDKQ